MELHQLRYFVAVAREGSMTAAASSLFLAQPTLSIQIRKLEQEVGAKLFERLARRVVLTAAGKAFLEHAERALAELERGRERVADVVGLRQGRVAVGVLPSVAAHLLPAVLAEFRAEHPGVTVHLVENDVSRDFEQLVQAGELDVAVTRMPVTLAGLGARTLVREPIVALVPPGHPLAGRAGVALRELADEGFVCMRSGYGLRELTDQLCAEAGFVPRVVIETGQLSIVHGMVRSGVGVALLPRLAARGAEHVVPVSDPHARRELGVVWRRSAQESPPVAAFLDRLLATCDGASELRPAARGAAGAR
ncbi:DNA-binding transcriptional LysR family regulator [Pseudonocardia hierapolitana]|uniref:DNA-binding transcriptional LysR family regulator n=1 Tax=Pseudonocardia hierapolitana TaxID=1128676 RepID=A0A561SY82_9PSEU|nr:LysR family transcriptional regulator [Pseudonocardia hierapolitana]TWF79801.1 DNA-binding transcriptional LysR family regulator [Pseudonocardia hierapolitana]